MANDHLFSDSPCPKCGKGTLSTSGGRTPLKCIRASCNYVIGSDPCVELGAIHDLVEAIRLSVEYVGVSLLQPIRGWTWYDALVKYAPEVAQQFRPAPVAEVREHGVCPRDGCVVPMPHTHGTDADVFAGEAYEQLRRMQGHHYSLSSIDPDFVPEPFEPAIFGHTPLDISREDLEHRPSYIDEYRAQVEAGRVEPEPTWEVAEGHKVEARDVEIMPCSGVCAAMHYPHHHVVDSQGMNWVKPGPVAILPEVVPTPFDLRPLATKICHALHPNRSKILGRHLDPCGDCVMAAEVAIEHYRESGD